MKIINSVIFNSEREYLEDLSTSSGWISEEIINLVDYHSNLESIISYLKKLFATVGVELNNNDLSDAIDYFMTKGISYYSVRDFILIAYGNIK